MIRMIQKGYACTPCRLYFNRLILMCFALDSRGALESQPGLGQLHGPGWHCLERGGAECEPSWALDRGKDIWPLVGFRCELMSYTGLNCYL